MNHFDLQAFEPLDLFFVRVSNFPLHPSATIASALDRFRIDPALRAALAIANPNLFLSLQKGEQTGHLEEKAAASLLKYLLRTASRATPFGLFSSVGWGTFSDNVQLNLEHATFQIHAVFDREWTNHLIDQVHQISLRDLRVMTNPGVYVRGNRIVLPRVSIHDNGKSYLSIQATSAIHCILSEAKETTLYQDLEHQVAKNFPKIHKAKIHSCLQNLLQKGFILSELQRPFQSHADLVGILRRLPPKEELEKVISLLEILEEKKKTLCAPPPKHCEDEIAEIQKITQCIRTKTPPLYINSYIHCDVSLPKTVQHTVHTALEIAYRFSDLESTNQEMGDLRHFHSYFLDKFGIDTLVSLQRIIGSPPFYDLLYPATPPSSHRELRLSDAIHSCTKEIDLEVLLESMPELKYESLTRITPSAEVYFEIASRSGDDLKAGDYTILINNISTQAGASMGRFLTPSYNQLAQHVHAIHQKEEALFPEDIFVEVSFLPDDPCLANRCATHLLRSTTLQMHYFEEGLTLENIEIGAKSDHLYLFSKKLNRKIHFSIGSSLNLKLTPPTIRFLILISRMRFIGSLNPFWERSTHSRFMPRIRYQNIIFSPAKWMVSRADILMNESESREKTKKKLWDYFHSHEIPDRCCLVRTDNKLNLFWKNQEHFGLIFDEWIKHSHLTIHETLSDEHNMVFRSGQGKHVTECVAQFIKKSEYIKDEKISPTALRTSLLPLQEPGFFPGSEWLYGKVFLCEEEIDYWIGDFLTPFTSLLLDEHLIDQWFYVRYKENNRSHVRLRLHAAETHAVHKLIDRMSMWVNRLMTDQVCDDFALCPYERETEKYGGSHSILLVEKFFFLDSMSCAQLITWLNRSNLFDPFTIAAFGIFNILVRIFEDDLEKITQFLKPSETEKHLLAGMRSLSTATIPYMRSILFKLEEKQDAHLRLVFSAYAGGWKGLAELKDGLSQMDDRQRQDMINNLLHMHCNRMLGPSRHLEQKARVAAFYFASRLEKSLLFTQVKMT